MTATTTEATYDVDLCRADSHGWERFAQTTIPERELFEQERKSWTDALNNVWVEGLTIEGWVDKALACTGRD